MLLVVSVNSGPDGLRAPALDGLMGCRKDECYRGEIRQGLQLTNIVKDIARDLHRGRCYVPESLLNEAGLKPADLLDEKNLPEIQAGPEPAHRACRGASG